MTNSEIHSIIHETCPVSINTLNDLIQSCLFTETGHTNRVLLETNHKDDVGLYLMRLAEYYNVHASFREYRFTFGSVLFIIGDETVISQNRAVVDRHGHDYLLVRLSSVEKEQDYATMA